MVDELFINTPSKYKSTDLLPASELREAAQSIFADIDSDKNGFLTRKELAASIEDPSYSGQEAQAVAALVSKK